MVAPDPFGQRGLVDRVVGAGHEVVEDVVLLAQQLHLAARHLDPAAVGPQAHVARVEALVTAALVTAQDAADAGAQFRQVERLGKVVVGAEFQPLDLVVEGIAGRNDDHRSRAATPLQLFEQPQAAAAGQHDVQQDAVVVVCGDLVERRGVIGGLLDDVLLPGQRPDHDLPQGGFVFNNEYLHNTLLFLVSRDRGRGENPVLKPAARHRPPKPVFQTGEITARIRKETEMPGISAARCAGNNSARPAVK